ncbi:hypothetical protein NPIL_121721 [Nephila pilipes]|uniref:Uncharacterized protein n=1 Tax=Nephila pilipes TaxID=299642 RepID=A0A8X6PUT7_NEPPI|nr:hypothetical protein NPIL_121721 [Nephila pilipes]
MNNSGLMKRKSCLMCRREARMKSHVLQIPGVHGPNLRKETEQVCQLIHRGPGEEHGTTCGPSNNVHMAHAQKETLRMAHRELMERWRKRNCKKIKEMSLKMFHWSHCGQVGQVPASYVFGRSLGGRCASTPDGFVGDRGSEQENLTGSKPQNLGIRPVLMVRDSLV